jgi:hypothetical protein
MLKEKSLNQCKDCTYFVKTTKSVMPYDLGKSNYQKNICKCTLKDIQVKYNRLSCKNFLANCRTPNLFDVETVPCLVI